MKKERITEIPCNKKGGIQSLRESQQLFPFTQETLDLCTDSGLGICRKTMIIIMSQIKPLFSDLELPIYFIPRVPRLISPH